MNLLKLIMYYAPIGLGVYFAVLIGTFGASLAPGYAKTFIVYTLVSIVFFFVAYSIYAYIAGGKNYSAPIQLMGDFLNDKFST